VLGRVGRQVVEPLLRRSVLDLQLPAVDEDAAIGPRAPVERRPSSRPGRPARGRRRPSRDRPAGVPRPRRPQSRRDRRGRPARRPAPRAAAARATSRRTACAPRPRRTSSSNPGTAG
jgi:hypothetical protein